jgi:hypothetical protein
MQKVFDFDYEIKRSNETPDSTYVASNQGCFFRRLSRLSPTTSLLAPAACLPAQIFRVQHRPSPSPTSQLRFAEDVNNRICRDGAAARAQMCTVREQGRTPAEDVARGHRQGSCENDVVVFSFCLLTCTFTELFEDE